jgi:glyoxylase-like metal-dependent hydrolase (beta-lactamase superfamily II)
MSHTDADLSLSGAPARFAGGLHPLGDDLWAWLQPNGGTGEANAGVVLGTDAAAVIDTCWDHRQAARLLAAADTALGGAPITTVVNTHCNGDHWWGNALMPVAAEIITSTAGRAGMARERPRELATLSRALSFARRLPGRLGDDVAYLHAQIAPYRFEEVQLRLPSTTFDGEHHLGLGGRPVELIEVGPAHTEGDLVVHVPDAGVVFAADVLFVGQTPVMWSGPSASWVAALERVAALEPRLVVPGHGPLAEPSELTLHRDYWDWLGEGVARLFRRGRSARHATVELLAEADADRRPWARWEAPERTYISVAAEMRALEGRPPAESTRDMLDGFLGVVRTRRRLLGGGGRP